MYYDIFHNFKNILYLFSLFGSCLFQDVNFNYFMFLNHNYSNQFKVLRLINIFQISFNINFIFIQSILNLLNHQLLYQLMSPNNDKSFFLKNIYILNIYYYCLSRIFPMVTVFNYQYFIYYFKLRHFIYICF
jgi:hypothetical protein